MIHIDLFSGIGGFALAVDEVWPDAEHIFCEINPFCQKVLQKHWKESVIYGDIREVTADTQCSRPHTEKNKQELESERGDKLCIEQSRDIDLLTGGFPCQPFSQAGRRQGTSDNRYLWPEMRRVIRDFKPRWVVAENVRGLLTIEQGVVFEQVCTDLEREGYNVQAFIIPAVAVNAPHRRDRVWIIAYKSEQGWERNGIQGEGRLGQCCGDRKRQELQKFTVEQWSENWLEVATELCRVDDGFSEGLDFSGYTKAGHRVERLKALGNAIVPQVAIEIFKAIKEADNAKI